MVTLAAPSRERVLEGSRQLYHEVMAVRRAVVDGSRDQEVVNTEEAAALDEPTYKHYRGRVYRIAPIPYKAGFQLHRGIDAYQAAAKAGDPDAQEEALSQLVRLYRSLARPIGWRRLVAWVLPNPFRHASEKEIIALADFFWWCRTGESLLSSDRARARNRPSSTGSTGSRSSRGHTRRGSNGGGGNPVRTGTPSAGGGTSTA